MKNNEDALTVVVDKIEYDKMVEDLDFLNCLWDAGVDNWSGIDYAQEAHELNYPEDD